MYQSDTLRWSDLYMESMIDKPAVFGTVVRVPFDTEESEAVNGDFRDFRAGTLLSIDHEKSVAKIDFVHVVLGRQHNEIIEVPIEHVSRCLLPDGAPFFHRQTKEAGSILCFHKEEENYVHYFAQFKNSVESVSEKEIRFISHFQSPNPIDQLKSYELHNPIWREKRDQIIKSYRELQNTTFGIEDLVGTRVHLLNHQAEVIGEVLSHSICRFILADEVGLGKTIEACVILKSLRKRENISTLIIAPRTLIHQWYNELNNKFWLKFNVIEGEQDRVPKTTTDTIISIDALEKNPMLRLWIQMQEWGLLIIDEVHRVYLKPQLYENLLTLSEVSRHVLLLSATPIQRETEEYIALLKLLDPVQYNQLTSDNFAKMLKAQHKIREVVAYLAKDLTPDYFDADEFQDEIEIILEELDHDKVLSEKAAQVLSKKDLSQAKDVIAYICTNYRLENRIIRNRRKTLRDRKQVVLPDREFTLRYAYSPSDIERQIYEKLHTYVDICHGNPSYKSLLQYLFQAGSSSPFALVQLLNLRLGKLTPETLCAQQASVSEAFSLDKLPGEIRLCNDLIWLTEAWQEETINFVDSLPQRDLPKNTPFRLAQVIRAIDDQIKIKDHKVIVFSAWHPTLSRLESYLKRRYGAYRIAKFHVGMSIDNLQSQVDRFQSDKECCILLTDESGGEGRNFQIAQVIIHVDLPWTPAHIEQRIGRVDRLGRDGIVLSIIPFAFDTLEADLISVWQDAFQLFSLSMSGMEIVLESIQKQISEAFIKDSREGIANLCEEMIQKAEELRKIVEEERYYEENTGNLGWTKHLHSILKYYSEKDVLREPVLSWADLAGLHHQYNPKTDIVQIGKADFNIKSIQNAKFISPPNMEEALERSGRPNNQKLIGTFNRNIAVNREDIIFFAPGEPWTDNILRNAILSDRGRCCAIQRSTNDLQNDWYGFEFLFSCRVNPRPFYHRGLFPIHLFKAGEFFTLPATHSYLVSINGQIMEYDSPEMKAINPEYTKLYDVHLGQRAGNPSPLQQFKSLFPPNIWGETVRKAYLTTLEHLHNQNDNLTEEDAEQAQIILDQRLRGLRAAITWLPKEKQAERHLQFELIQSVSDSIIEGISNTEWILESACFWILKSKI